MSKNLFLFLVMAVLVAGAPMAAWGDDCSNYQQRMQQARNEAQKNRENANRLMAGNTYWTTPEQAARDQQQNRVNANNYVAAANRLEQYAVQLGQACSGGNGYSSGMGNGGAGGGSGYSSGNGYGGAGGGSGYEGIANVIQGLGQLLLQKEERAEERRRAAAEAQRAAQEQQQAEREAEERRQEYLRLQQSEQRKTQQLNDAISAEIARDELNSQLDAQLQPDTSQRQGICWDGSSPNKYGGCPDLVFPGPQKQGAADKVANLSLNEQLDRAMAEDDANQKMAQLELESRSFLNTPANAPFTYQDALPVSTFATSEKATTEDMSELGAAEKHQSSGSLLAYFAGGVKLTGRQIKDATARVSAAMHQFPFPHLYKGAPGIVEDHLNVLDDYINRNF